MNPSGILRSTETGVDLEISRTIGASREDVWSTLTESDRTALWFGPWERLSDSEIRVQMTFEEGAPWMEMTVDACESPNRLAVSSNGGWRLEVVLTDDTTLTLIHHLDNTEGVGEIGPGWEYYLDNLLASRDGTPKPSFDDYFPSQQVYYASLSAR
ncbi:SRPBCC domain-containing protein [Rhodococcoides yunnanense]|uniref:SRPBCC domain-containing protein n=1 Tax=Rhodococcoides yunnanense TaxID=278209 RepID=UPI0009331216|nr:SRPBCC domain-containing protein [Rhodococcus yunnanensis]